VTPTDRRARPPSRPAFLPALPLLLFLLLAPTADEARSDEPAAPPGEARTLRLAVVER
jgi:hypothetical protein